MNKRMVVISASFGAGHDGAAAELTRRLTGRGVTVERYDFVDLLPRRAGRVLRGLYRRQLTAAPQTWGWLLALSGARGSTALATRLTAMADRAVLDAVGSGADAVISTYPLASQVLGRLREQGRLDVPVYTYLTDLSVHPLWVCGGVDVHLALHDDAARQAKEHGAADVRVVAPAVSPRFAYSPPPAGFPRALVVAGAWGVGAIEAAAADISATGLARPVVVCGRNEPLRRRIERGGFGDALGWVDDMPALMRDSHVVVQNAGGLSSLEALAAGRPVVTYRCLPGHGRTNAEVLDRIGWVPWIRDRGSLAAGLREALRDPRPFAPAAQRPEDVLA
ncbi:glycosyltransferase [Dactylosporangium sp. NPDC048998]|uniref:MGDG synthase family glycosyltransferase n=1 Tax=Dactylosporangium sp. NPDC048998 TaxID=3363976 RepID=UPI00371788D8